MSQILGADFRIKIWRTMGSKTRNSYLFEDGIEKSIPRYHRLNMPKTVILETGFSIIPAHS